MEKKATGYYTNPAFSQQSEFYTQSLHRNIRQSPVGAQTNHIVIDSPESSNPDDPDHIEEQEFYEEVLVDDKGFIKGKQFVVVAQNNEGQKYIQMPVSPTREQRISDKNYAKTVAVQYSTKPKPIQSATSSSSLPQKVRYEYIPMQEQYDSRVTINRTKTNSDSVPQVHRYAVIDPGEEDKENEEETQLINVNNQNGRYALVPVNEISPSRNRYEYIQESSPTRNNNRYEYIEDTSPNTPSHNRSRSVPALSTPRKQNSFRYTVRPGTNPVATQKLYELLSTPRKVPQRRVLSPQTNRRTHINGTSASPPLSPIPKDPFQTTPSSTSSSPRKVHQHLLSVPRNSKAQQRLNYSIATNHPSPDKRHTAVVPPMMCPPPSSSPIIPNGVYGETTTYYQKSESLLNLSLKNKKNGVGKALMVTAIIMFLCGNLTAGLSFYLTYQIGRWYYLDFSIVAGFVCIALGVLGLRSRKVSWLPNRNYLSGYLLLSLFSILTCASLLVMVIKDPIPGTPIADITSVAICGFSLLTLLLSVTGLISSYCCKYPPPDNRVQHCSPRLRL